MPTLTASGTDVYKRQVLLHLGTLAAVFLAFRGEIAPLWNEGLRMLHLKKTRRGEEPDGVKRRMIWRCV